MKTPVGTDITGCFQKGAVELRHPADTIEQGLGRKRLSTTKWAPASRATEIIRIWV